MGNFAKDFVSILQYLLPGFVSAWVFYGLTSYPKPSQFERVVQAMIFTLFTQASINIVEFILKWIGSYWSVANWGESSSLIWSIIIALFFGFIFSYFANNDKLHKYLRGRNITHQTSYPSEWFGVFLDSTFVVLHFNDERRLYGWPIEWPSEPSKGYFVIADPSWLLDNGKEQRITGVKNMLINVNDVKWIEFLEKTWESNDEKRV
ncbi:hypothetical protein B0F87_101109 [Methylobacter tundripaludum]|uniref:Uncharacterized protein n=1 Tax=Methylobacter tundripaludum TaxID=173365 RepID=A0A2S6HK32_9GAMM|nr:DUF6338 family protein [Methylobacter tundripaludum]PPK77731.1 hypothetical protein B0F87_101109 [Methylobacter tundripaludum]